MFVFQVLNVLTWCLRIQGRRTASSKTIEISRVYWHNLRETSPREYHEMTFHRALWRLMLVCGFVEVAAGKPARVNPSTVPEVWIEHIWSYLNIVFGQSVIFSQEVTQKKDQQNGFWGILPKSPQHTTAAVEIRLVQILFMDKIRKTYGGGAVKLPNRCQICDQKHQQWRRRLVSLVQDWWIQVVEILFDGRNPNNHTNCDGVFFLKKTHDFFLKPYINWWSPDFWTINSMIL